jgi:DNA repair exonuclease SbcCD ATPase subunit
MESEPVPLVARLRAEVPFNIKGENYSPIMLKPGALSLEAATALEAAQAEIEALRRERDEAREVFTHMSEEFRAAALCDAVQASVGENLPKLMSRIAEAEAAREAAEAKAARLEEALRSVAANTCCDTCREAALVARAALGGRE